MKEGKQKMKEKEPEIESFVSFQRLRLTLVGRFFSTLTLIFYTIFLISELFSDSDFST